MLKLSICLADQIRENFRDSVANFLYCLSAFSRCRPSVFVDIPSRYRLIHSPVAYLTWLPTSLANSLMWNNIRRVKCTAIDLKRLTRIIITDSSVSSEAKFADFLNENPNSFQRATLHKKLKELGYSRELWGREL